MPANWFATSLLNWHKENYRHLPWKVDKDPYKIWLSEIILQQTRVDQGIPYYHKFIETFPTVQELAKASESDVLKLWEGLGYYSRARNLHFTAQYISDHLNGIFPNTYSEILKLKGVGPYTAAAIASFAFNLPHAVVDGNVYRVLSRILGIKTPLDSTEGKKEFQETAQNLLDSNNPGAYNQAIMDFGATVCTPKNPHCFQCPFSNQCYALSHNIIDQLPIKSKKIQRKNRYLYYFVLCHNNEIAIKQRNQEDIWKGLYDFYLIENTVPINQPESLIQHHSWSITSMGPTVSYWHKLTHRDLMVSFTVVQLNKKEDLPKDMFFIKTKNLSKFAFPKVIHCFFEDNPLTLKDSF